MWIDADDLRSDIQTQITKIEGRGRTHFKTAREHYERLKEEK